jgi:hypothetical protein
VRIRHEETYDFSSGTKDIKPLLSTPGSDGRAGGAIDSGGPNGPGLKCQKTAGGAQGAVHVKETPDSAVAGATVEGVLFF